MYGVLLTRTAIRRLPMRWNRSIAMPIKRAPIQFGRRTGNEILYPRVMLPERIGVRAVLRTEEDY